MLSLWRHPEVLYEAFALTRRIADCECTHGAALGCELLGFQPVLEPPAKKLKEFLSSKCIIG